MRLKAATSRSASQAERRRPSAEMFVDAARIRPQMTGNAAKRQRAIHKLPLPQGAGSLSVTSVPWVDFGCKRQAEALDQPQTRSEEHTSELQSLMRRSSAGFYLYKKT